MDNGSISRQAVIDELRKFKPEIIPYEKARIYVEETINTMYDRIEELPSVQPEQQHGRVFKGIVVKYPSYNTYPEYKGKPYFSIKYTEKGQSFIGYGTYNPEVLSEYLKEYFMPPAQPEQRWILCDEKMPEEHEWLGTKKFGTTISDEVYVTFENEKGERFCKHMSFQNGKLSNYDQFHMDTWYKGSKPIAWMPLPEPYKPNNK